MNKPKLDHIGIAVKSLDAAKVYETLGLTIDHVETVETQKVKTAFLSVGDSQLELLEPTGPDSTIAKFIEKRGEGPMRAPEASRVGAVFNAGDSPALPVPSERGKSPGIYGETFCLADRGATASSARLNSSRSTTASPTVSIKPS